MIPDWSSLPGPKLYTSRPEPVRLINGTPYLSYTREYPYGASYAALVQVVQPLRGSPVLAIGGEYQGDASTWCVGSATAGEFGAMYLALGQDASAYEVDWSTWDAVSAFSSHVFSSSAVPIGNQYAVGVNQAALGPAAFMDFSTQAIHAITTLPSGIFSLDLPTIVPDGAFVVEQNTNGLAIGLLHSDAALSTIVDPTASSRSVTWLTVDRSNGNQLVWIESDSSDLASNPIIWTSPYATTSAGVTRNKVAAYQDATASGGADGVTNAGVMLNVVDDAKALLTRLSDGMGWSITAEPGMHFVQPLWVDDAEVWILASTLGVHDPDRILRLQRANLGAPTVPRGF